MVASLQPALFASPGFKKIETAFWWVFVLFPLLTGLFWYDWQPNEAFNSDQYVLIASHEVCQNDGLVCDQMPDVWRDKHTWRIYTREDFAVHRKSEAMRLAAAVFAYGLIGCFFYAYVGSKSVVGSFYGALGKAVCVNTAVSGFEFFHLYF